MVTQFIDGRWKACLGLMILQAFFVAHAETKASDIHGVWATQGMAAQVEITDCDASGDTQCGRFIWSWNPEALDTSPDAPAFMTGLRLEDDVWVGGKLNNPEDGRTYRGTVRLHPSGALLLKGCFLMICRDQVWRRMDTIPGCRAPDHPVTHPAVQSRIEADTTIADSLNAPPISSR